MRKPTSGLTFLAIAVLTSLVCADDLEIAENIVSKLQKHKDAGSLRDFNIGLEVEEGTVWLIGQVESEEQQNLVLNTTREVQGVQHIFNGLLLKNTEPQANAPVAKKPATKVVETAQQQELPKAQPKAQPKELPKELPKTRRSLLEIAKANAGGLFKKSAAQATKPAAKKQQTKVVELAPKAATPKQEPTSRRSLIEIAKSNADRLFKKTDVEVTEPASKNLETKAAKTAPKSSEQSSLVKVSQVAKGLFSIKAKEIKPNSERTAKEQVANRPKPHKSPSTRYSQVRKESRQTNLSKVSKQLQPAKVEPIEIRESVEAVPVQLAGHQTGKAKPAKLVVETKSADQKLAESVIETLQELKKQGKLRRFSLDLDVTNGSVWIKGRVASDEQRQLVLNMVRRVQNVRQVVNDIKITASPKVATTSPKVANDRRPIPEPIPAVPAVRRQVAEAKPAVPKVSLKEPAVKIIVPTVSVKEPAAKPIAPPVSVKEPAAKPIAPPVSAKEPATDPAPPTVSPQVSVPSPANLPISPKEETVQITQQHPATSVVTEVPKLMAEETVLHRASPIPEVPVGTAAIEPTLEKSKRSVTQATIQQIVAPRTPEIPVQLIVAPVPQVPTAQQVQALQANRMPMPFATSQANYATGLRQINGNTPVPAHYGSNLGVAPARYDHPQMPGYAWPSYAPHPNYGAVSYPKQYSPTAWPYIGPFYPYPQVPLGWRKVTLKWDDGWWVLDFKSK